MTRWNFYNGTSKYKAVKVEVDGITFASKKEASRYQELKLLESQGIISNLKMQVKYILIPNQREPEQIGARGKKKPGKVIERELSYIADFVYNIPDSPNPVVEDTKGFRTKEYRIKKKLLLWFYGIRIKEV